MQENSGNDIVVSVVIPVYNGENHIAATLDSVLSQSLKNFEIIIVNDGSTDSTKIILGDYSARFPFLHIIEKQKSGVSSARNSGLEIAKGEFISFLDADDIWQKGNLEVKTDFLRKNENAFAVTSFCEIIDENGNKIGEIKKGDASVTLKDILFWKGNYITVPSGILFRTETIRKLNGFHSELSNNADQEILMRGLHTRKMFYTLQTVTWQYRRHSSNMSSNIPLMEKDTVLSYRLADSNGMFASSLFRSRCFSRMSLILAFSWWKNGKDKTRALKWAFKSFGYSPADFTERIFHRIFNRKQI